MTFVNTYFILHARSLLSQTSDDFATSWSSRNFKSNDSHDYGKLVYNELRIILR